MAPASMLVDTVITGFLLGAAAGVPLVAMQSPASDLAILRDLAGAGGIGVVLALVWMNQKDRREEREKQAEERQKAADLLAKEREQAAEERKHGMDRVSEITATFSKTVLDLTRK